MRFACLLLTGLVFAQEPAKDDPFPNVRSVISEVTDLMPEMTGRDAAFYIGMQAAGLYVRAGYIDDAQRLYMKMLARASNPGYKSILQRQIATNFWKKGQSPRAKIYLDAAQQSALQSDPASRKGQLYSVNVTRGILSQPPPPRSVPEQHPVKRVRQEDSKVPMFPMTTDGFEERTPEQIAARSAADAEFMQLLYARMASRDREGLMKIVANAASPFQKALGLASIEHILIQAKQPADAEHYANLIPTITASTTLAKAEALNGAAGAWIRAGDSAKAQVVYDAAVALVQSVSTLPFGKVSVLTDIAVAQFKGGLVATSGATLKLAFSLAREIPVVISPDAPAKVVVTQTHSRNGAYQKILNAGVRTHNLTVAFEAAEEWSKLGGRGGAELVRACMNMDQDEAAAEYAHKISGKNERADALLTLAENLLDNAGVPR